MLLKYLQPPVPPLATTQYRGHVTALCYKYMTIIKKKNRHASYIMFADS